MKKTSLIILIGVTSAMLFAACNRNHSELETQLSYKHAKLEAEHETLEVTHDKMEVAHTAFAAAHRQLKESDTSAIIRLNEIMRSY